MKKLIILYTVYFILNTSFLSAFEVGCYGDCEKIGPKDSLQENNLFWDGKDKVVSLKGAKNEYVAFQIIIKAGKSLSGVKVEAEEFKSKDGVISKSNIELFKEHYLDVTLTSRSDKSNIMKDAKAGEVTTQMIPSYAPKGGFPFEVKAGRNQPVWVDVYIPAEAKAGEYDAGFTVLAEGEEAVKLKVKLTVWNFALPEETHFRTYLYYGAEQIKWAHRYKDYGEKFRTLEDKFLQMAHQHRFVACPGLELADAKFDFETYWKKYGGYIDGSAYKEKTGKNTPVNTWVVSIDNDNDNAYKAAAKAVVDYFDKKGLTKILMLYVYDEPGTKEDYDIVKKRGELIHAATGKKLPVMLTEQIAPQNSSWGSLEGSVDIWNSGGSSWTDMKRVMAKGDRVWTYNAGWGGGPYVDTPGIAGRTQGWVGWKFGFDGWEFWDATYWIDKHNLRKGGATHKVIDANPEKYMIDLYENPLNFDETRKPNYPERDAIRINGDGIVFYPGYDVGLDEPVASFVMKSLRRGLQDYEYLWLLKKAGKESELKPIVDSLIPGQKTWNGSVTAWYDARLKLGALLDSK